MPKVFTSKTHKTGEIGEHIAVRYLVNKGYSIVERNYTKKWGEIDIVAKKGAILHFIEVKSKEIDTISNLPKGDAYRPEDAMHPWKLKRLSRTIQTYLLEKDTRGEWQFDLAVVYLALGSNEAKVSMLENVIL